MVEISRECKSCHTGNPPCFIVYVFQGPAIDSGPLPLGYYKQKGYLFAFLFVFIVLYLFRNCKHHSHFQHFPRGIPAGIMDFHRKTACTGQAGTGSIFHSSISSRVGMALWAPGRVTAMPDARLAKGMASAWDFPLCMAAVKAPRKVSPAPVVSRAFCAVVG